MMLFHHLLLVLALVPCAFATEDLPECQHDMETLFYNAYVDLENLPSACNNNKALLDIGFIIQDSFEEADQVMRGFQEERVQTQPCPFPNVGEGISPLGGMRLRQPIVVGVGGPIRYQATGRGERCTTTSTTTRTRRDLNHHEDRNDDRMLQKSDICALADGAERDANRAQEAVVSAELVMQGLEEMKDILASPNAIKLVDRAQGKLSKCREQSDKVTVSHGLVAAWCQEALRGRSSSRLQRQAEKQAERARVAADKAEKFMLEMLEYEKDLAQDLPDQAPTESNVSPTTTDMESTPLTAGQKEYIDRLKSNIESSNTECAEVANAMLQKTLAEESVRASNVVYDEIEQSASASGGDARVERVKVKADMLRLMVKEEAAKARAAADRVSDLCAKVQGLNGRSLQGNEALLEETEAADAAVLESRMALLEEKRTEQELYEVLGLIEFEKNEFYQSLAPETSSSPSLFYAVRSGEVENVVPSRQPGKARSKAEWLQYFGNMLVSDIFTRIMLSYNPRFGGCVMPGSGFAVVVNITELQTVVEEFLPAKCPTSFLARDPVPREPVMETNEEQPTQANTAPEPSSSPTVPPSSSPSYAPSEIPTLVPSGAPPSKPSHQPSIMPTESVTRKPASSPTRVPAKPPVGGVTVFNDGALGSIKRNVFNGAAFLDDSTPPEIADIGSSRWRWLQGADAPTRKEKVVVSINDDGTITAVMCSGPQCTDSSSWNEISISPLATDITSSLSWPHANVAYESKKGRAILVWDDGRPRFSIFDGSGWSNAAVVDPTFSLGPLWIELASNPQNDEIILAFGTESALYTSFWDGSNDSWSPISSSVSSLSQCSGFAIAYEAKSPNRAILVHGRARGESDSNNALYRIQSGTSWGDVETLIPTLGGRVHWASLQSDPNTNRLALGIHDTSNDGHLAIWDGDSNEWTSISRDVSTSLSASNNRKRISVAFESQSGKALAVLGKSSGNTLEAFSWTPGGNWMSEDDVDVDKSSNVFTLDSNPNMSSNEIMLSVQGNRELRARLWNGATSSWESLNPDPLGSNTFEGTRTQPFVFIWNH